jgi:hypothetical protein
MDDLGLDPGVELRDLQSRVLTGDRELVPAVREPSPERTAVEVHLPRRLTRLIGREAGLTRLAALVGDQPLVTVTGPGGCGKTTAAVEVAKMSAGDFADGVWFVDLTAVADSALVVEVVLSTLALSASPTDDPREALTAARGRCRSGGAGHQP